MLKTVEFRFREAKIDNNKEISIKFNIGFIGEVLK
jgi:hypothetical protein